jgi:hypothetical protein
MIRSASVHGHMLNVNWQAAGTVARAVSPLGMMRKYD